MRGELHHTFSAHAALQFTNDTINDFRWFLLKADVEGLARLTTNQTHRRSIYYRARVSSGEGREGSSPGRTQNTSRPTESLIFLLVQNQDGAKHGRRCNHSTWPLDDPWAAFRWTWPTGLRQSFAGHCGHVLEPM